MALAFYPPSCYARAGYPIWRRYTWTCSLQSAQPCDHPQAGGLLHHLLTLTHCWAVILFCRNLLSPIASTFRSGAPYAARTFLWHKCQRQAETVFSGAKVDIFIEIRKLWLEELYLPLHIITNHQLKYAIILKFVYYLRFEVLNANSF